MQSGLTVRSKRSTAFILLLDKVTDIKGKHLWNEVIDEYREKKNLYLCRQDYNHPSFNVYVETVNQVFNKYFD